MSIPTSEQIKIPLPPDERLEALKKEYPNNCLTSICGFSGICKTCPFEQYKTYKPPVESPTFTPPKILIKWIRGSETINYKRPSTYLIMGGRGSGKSSMLETIGSRYCKIIDLFGSKDAECLSWCKDTSPFKKVLFIIGRNMKVVSHKYQTVYADEVTLRDFEENEVITTTYTFFNTTKEYFDALQKITTLLWDQRTYWTEPWFLLIREAANWIYARLQVVKDSDSAKADFIQMLREARHSGLAVGVDTIRWTNIDKEVRDISDYVFIKKVGSIGLPKDLRFIYRYVNPVSLMKLKPPNFVLLTSEGNLGIGKFEYPKWHKEECENIMAEIGIETERLCQAPAVKGNTVGILEHSQIIDIYKRNRSLRKTAAIASRDFATVVRHIDLHNDTIKEVGYCLECRTAKSELDKEILVKRGRVP